MLKYVDTLVTFSKSYPESKDLKYGNYVVPTTDGLRFY